MVKTDDFEQVEVQSTEALRAWLAAHHQQEESIWIVTYKKHIEDKYVSSSEVLDELLCFGWIDGIRRKLDQDRTMQLIGPRRAQHWSKTYKERAAKLQEEGRMTPAGLACIESSKAAGLWNFLDDVDALIKPADLIEALDATPPAMENFNAFAPSAQRFTLRWIKLAKTAKTRAKRIARAAELAAKNEKIPGL